MIDPRYPIGPAPELPQQPLSQAERQQAISNLAQQPQRLAQAVGGFTDEQLNTPYLEGGWTVRQVVHHVADSHLNAYLRTKLALTEDNPVIKPYDEQRWADLPDSHLPIDTSLVLLEHLHGRWVALLEQLTAQQFQRPYVHPVDGPRTIEQLLVLYVWHGNHHTAQITTLMAERGWR